MTAWGSKRDRLRIYLDVLKVIRKGESKPTRIMYSSNLSWKPLKQILNSLIDQEIVEVTRAKSHNVYSLTEKGFDVLEYFDAAKMEIRLD
jgi:predicted transcriptional regulator